MRHLIVAYRLPCVIWLDHGWLRSTRGRGAWGHRMRCDTIVHEAGHIAGIPHVNDPRSVMAPGDLGGWDAREARVPYDCRVLARELVLSHRRARAVARDGARLGRRLSRVRMLPKWKWGGRR